MTRTLLVPGALALALTAIPHARAASDADLADIRDQIRALRQSYESRIEALERRLREAEAQTRNAAPIAAAPATPSASANAFNPAISLVLQGNYANLSQDPAKYALYGFAPGGEIGPGKKGFSLAESEIGIAASVDDKFTGKLIASLTPEETVAVEEPYGVFTAAPGGLVPKFGRYFIGDRLPQRAAPARLRLLRGAARLRGAPRRQVRAGRPAGEVGRADRPLPRGRRRGRQQRGLSGNGPRPQRLRKRRGLRPHRRGHRRQQLVAGRLVLSYLTYDSDGSLGLTQEGAYRSTQSGWYLQGVYQFMPAWRVGLRYDQLSVGTIDYGDNAAYLGLGDFAPKRAALMVDWTPSEFSRVRAQFARSETVPGLTDNQFFLQYILSLGAHGAHKY